MAIDRNYKKKGKMKKNLKKFSKLEINNLSWKEMRSITAGAGSTNTTVYCNGPRKGDIVCDNKDDGGGTNR